jgi:hypothetical protein
MDFEKNGTGVVYHGSECGPERVIAYQDGGMGEQSDCSMDVLHPALIAIVWDVLKAGEEVKLPLYDSYPHFWTLEELKASYKIKTGNDFDETETNLI